jgi:hypothetical protein
VRKGASRLLQAQACPTRILLDWNNADHGPATEFLGNLRPHARLRRAPRWCSAPPENDVAHYCARSFTHGANEYIMKPFDKGHRYGRSTRKSGLNLIRNVSIRRLDGLGVVL